MLLVPIIGCFVSGSNGDPGPAFESSGRHPGPGYTGSAGAGSTGAGGAGGAAATDGGAGTTDASFGDASVPDGATGDGATADGARPSACSSSATATFTMSWTVEDGAGAASTCAAQGGQTVDISVVSQATGAAETLTVPCATMAAATCAMPAGAYAVTLSLRDATGGVLAEIVGPTLFLIDGTSTQIASLPFSVGGADATDGRGFALTWSIEKDGTNAAETCAQAGAMSVRVAAGTTTFDLACADGKGRTTSIAPGDYPVTLHLLDAQGADLSVTQTMTLHIDEGQLLFLGNVVFDVI